MSQEAAIYKLLLDYRPHRVDEIINAVYGSEGPSVARIGARIHGIKEKYGVSIESWPDPNNRKLWVYQLVKKGERQQDFISDASRRAMV